MSYAEILYEVRDGVATVTLNRPERLNAWTAVMEGELRQALEAAARDEAVKVIVITGAGRGFCAGADMGGLQGRAEGGSPAPAASNAPSNAPQAAERRLIYILGIPKPVIAAINGPVAGIGLCMTLFCDIRFVADNAKVTTAFAERGLIAEYSSAWLLPRLVGPMNAQIMFYSARPMDGAAAAALGYARLLPAEGFAEAVHAFAAQIAARSSPRSMRVMKRQVYEALDMGLMQAADIAEREMLESFRSEDFKEGVAHYVEKRPAQFTGR
jgi:enoyl-CoA hydratase/carnithine racemase